MDNQGNPLQGAALLQHQQAQVQAQQAQDLLDQQAAANAAAQAAALQQQQAAQAPQAGQAQQAQQQQQQQQPPPPPGQPPGPAPPPPPAAAPAPPAALPATFTGPITSACVFHGFGPNQIVNIEPVNSLDGEAFWNYIVNLGATNGLGQNDSATTFIAGLRDEAVRWWERLEADKMIDIAEWEAIKISLARIKPFFKLNYFKLASEDQVSLDFTNLKQMSDDTPLTFANRVHDTVIQWTKLLAGNVPREEDILIPDEAWAGSGLVAANAPDLFKAFLRRNIRQARLAQHTLTNNYFGHSTCRKIIIAGLADQKLKDKVMDSDRRGESMELVKAMLRVEQRKIARYHKPVASKKPVLSVASEEPYYDEDDVEAISNAGRKQNGRKKNTGGNAKNNFGNTNSAPINQALGHRMISETADETPKNSQASAGAVFRGRGRGTRRGGRAPRGGAPRREWKECTYCLKFGHEESECFMKTNVMERGRQELAQRQRVAEATPSGDGQQNYQHPSASPVNDGQWYSDTNSVN
jgi:hypothetical protein